MYRVIASDAARNQLIARDIAHTIEEGRNPIVLTERKDHLESLADLIRGVCPRVAILRGGPECGEARGRERGDIGEFRF